MLCDDDEHLDVVDVLIYPNPPGPGARDERYQQHKDITNTEQVSTRTLIKIVDKVEHLGSIETIYTPEVLMVVKR